ncbi:Protein trichome birefringence-like 34 [Dichanthelium oligosanthes]|uniref:Protein trichome birefringence-like 34 n=1 Tax=Dichanthelium oligosanthes TaxID=888268 RepID=A0A1E5USR5_9POAL|nr:Protein trichome birefringence-like 34 [Dichanthelium oligosanthes]
MIPARKGRSTPGAGSGGLEEAWLVVEAPPAKTKPHARAAAWGVTVSVGLRGHLYSLVLLVLVLVLVLAASVTTQQNGDGDGPEPQQAATTVPRSDKTAGVRGVHRHQAAGECDMSSGRWVYDDGAAYPLYEESACRFMSDQTACEKFGRKDLRYQRWRWQPHACDLPRFDAARLLRRLRHKRLAFVGDSLNRNQWVSMVCLIDTATPTLQKSMTNNGSLISLKIHEYNASVDFYWSPLLVESNSDHPVQHRMVDRVVRAGSIAKHARRWADAEVLVFNSYLWWRRPAIKVLWGSFESAAAEGAHRAAYEVTDGLRAFKLAVRTWSEWLELHVDRARTQLFFTSMSPTHQHSDEWDDGGASGSNHQCYNETEPIAGEGHRGRDTDPAFARAVEAEVARLGERGVAARVLNVTQLSEHRNARTRTRRCTGGNGARPRRRSWRRGRATPAAAPTASTGASPACQTSGT